MSSTLTEILKTRRQNWHFAHYPATALDPLDAAATIVTKWHTDVAAINKDTRLSVEGQAAARKDAALAAAAAIEKWHTPRLAALEAQLAAERTALLPKVEHPDGRKVDFMVGVLREYTADERAVLYNSATDEERAVMEAASQSISRIPQKTANGGLSWEPLLNPDHVNATAIARVQALNPDGAQKLTELSEIRDMQVTTFNVAMQEVKGTASIAR